LGLHPGEEITVADLRLMFRTVSQDSRCPVDVVCIWQGNAAVEVDLALAAGPSAPYTFDTSDADPSVTVGGFRVTLLALTPEPRADATIPPGDYRAWFRIESLSEH
jgi:hypothetical protein